MSLFVMVLLEISAFRCLPANRFFAILADGDKPDGYSHKIFHELDVILRVFRQVIETPGIGGFCFPAGEGL